MTTAACTQGFTEMGKLLTGEAATPMTKIGLIKTAITVDAAQNYAGITKCTESGLAVKTGTASSVQTTVANDTSQISATFTPGAGVSVAVLGHFGANTDLDVLFGLSNDNYGAGGITLVGDAGDTLVATLGIQHKAG